MTKTGLTGKAMAQTTWRVSITVPARHAAAFEDLLSASLPAVTVFGEDGDPLRQIDGFGMEPPDAAGLSVAVAVLARARCIREPRLSIEAIPPTDWLAATYEAFPAIRVGRFHIRGSHDPAPAPSGTIGLCIDAATAFGTGQHETTAGCLMALERLAKRQSVRRVLDMGCGSGILAFAAARLWRAPVLALDVDPEAVRVARANVRINRVGRWVRAVAGNGYRDRRVAAGGPYDLIVANILAGPLAEMAKDLADNLAPGGTAVLAGLLTSQQAQVLAAHRMQGLELVARLPVGDWPTLVLRRRKG